MKAYLRRLIVSNQYVKKSLLITVFTMNIKDMMTRNPALRLLSITLQTSALYKVLAVMNTK